MIHICSLTFMFSENKTYSQQIPTEKSQNKVIFVMMKKYFN